MPSLMTIDATALIGFGKRLNKGQKQIAKDVEREFDAFGRLTVKTLQGNAPRKTGTFASGINYQVKGRGGANMQLEVRWSPKGGQPKQLADWIIFGTGVYGPRRKPIVPVRAKFLRFQASNGKIVFTKSVRGMKPRNFVRQSWSQLAGERRALTNRLGRLLANSIVGTRGGGRAF